MKIIYIFLLSTLFACGDNSDTSNKLKAKELELKEKELELKEKELNLADGNSKTKNVGYDFEPNVSITRSSANVDYKGAIIKQVSWKDENGENLALFTGNANRIWIYHYLFANGATTLLREFKDFITDCPFDINLEFIKESIDITDLDKDNYGELSFAYTLGCRSDVSPLDMKLIMTENGDKYIIRGRQTIVLSNETYHGDKKVDKSFQNGPSEFINYATLIWNRFERVDY